MVEVVTDDKWRKPIGDYLKKNCHISADIKDEFSYSICEIFFIIPQFNCFSFFLIKKIYYLSFVKQKLINY